MEDDDPSLQNRHPLCLTLTTLPLLLHPLSISISTSIRSHAPSPTLLTVNPIVPLIISPPNSHETAPVAGTEDAPAKPPVGKEGESANRVRVLLEAADRALPNSKPAAIDEVVTEGIDPMDRDVKFDIEDDDDGSSEPIIPGLSAGGGGDDALLRADEGGGDHGGDANDEWDSDSEDDLQIVLNDDNHMAMEKGGMVDDDDEDEDGGLVIVAGGEPN